MSAERVIVTRTEIRQVRDKAAEILAVVDAILRRPEPTTPDIDAAGWPILPGVTELPDDN